MAMILELTSLLMLNPSRAIIKLMNHPDCFGNINICCVFHNNKSITTYLCICDYPHDGERIS